MRDPSEFTAFLQQKGYNIIDENRQLHFITYENKGLFIRLSKEVSGEHFIELSRTNNHSWQGWFDMTIVRCLILKAPFEKGGPTDFEQLSQFFKEHYDAIESEFKPTNFLKTETALAALKKERAKVLFDYEP